MLTATNVHALSRHGGRDSIVRELSDAETESYYRLYICERFRHPAVAKVVTK